MPDNNTEFDALDELIDALEAADGGSRALDVQIEYCHGVALGGRVDVAGMLIEEGVSWGTVSETLERRVPLYTSSLDAEVKGENIEFAVKSASRERWGAMHRSAYRLEILAWATTEPLARRLAALKGWRADQQFERERDAAREREAAREEENGREDENGREQEDEREYERALDGDAGSQPVAEMPRRLVALPANAEPDAEEQDWKVLF